MTESSAILRQAGLCAKCQHCRIISTSRGSQFLMCTLVKVDPRFAKYPPLPVLRCVGFEAKKEDKPEEEDKQSKDNERSS